MTARPITLESTFVGARNPVGDTVNIEDRNEGVVIAPGDTVSAEGRVLLDSEGNGQVWPCYLLPGEQYCPDLWRVIFVPVGGG